MPNLLIHEKSPYLLQHAQNPVNWYPWGEAAFAKARAEDKPIFLSVGYSTCHWCHVMEHESFEQESVAAILNRYFVSVKVDREERPDVDRIYMAYVQAATGSGGWPMSVWLTPDLHPFVGGTYFPPDNRYGRPGFGAVCERIAQAWREERGRIGESSARVLEQMRAASSIELETGGPQPAALDAAFDYFRRTFDAQSGGFGAAPKFPRPVIFNFLLRYWARTGKPEALDMVTKTLHAMARGGMNDQLGGGFHRYSVDAYWFVPHFEKMLYDQAQLAVSYLEAFQITGDPLLRRQVERILDYILRDMTHPDGGFYSAEDADSAPDPAQPTHKSEGAFYIWSAAEVNDRYFAYRYGVEASGNVQDDPHNEFTGRNILFEAHTMEETAHHFDVPVAEAAGSVERTAARLLEERGKRPRPYRDDKVLTAWNGMMIRAFARAGAVLDEPRYRDAARRASRFIQGNLQSNLIENGRLLRRFREGSAAIPGFLDDYAAYIQALLELYQCELNPADLDFAVQLAGKQSALFEDVKEGGFFSTAEDAGDLVLRMKEDYDGAEPGANAVTASNLLLLARFTGHEDFRTSAERIFQAFASRINDTPFAVPQMLAAYQFSLGSPKEARFEGDPQSVSARELLRVFYERFLPDYTISRSLRTSDSNTPATISVCEDYVCQLPTSDVGRFRQLLQ